MEIGFCLIFHLLIFNLNYPSFYLMNVIFALPYIDTKNYYINMYV